VVGMNLIMYQATSFYDAPGPPPEGTERAFLTTLLLGIMMAW
jgi:hypothetical protein